MSARWMALAVCGPLLLAACQRPGTAAQNTQTQSTPAAQQTAPVPVSNNLDAAPAKTTALQVRVVPARAGALSVVRTASGTVKSGRDSNVAAQASGAVSGVLAQVGDQVRAGQVVVQLDPSSLQDAVNSARLQLQNAQINLAQGQRNSTQNSTQLQAAVASAQANLQKARQAAAANGNLYTLGGISRADLIASQAALAQAQADAAQAQNALIQNGRGGSVSVPLLQNQVAQAQGSLAQARQNLSRAGIRAPFAGVVASLPLSVGEYVQTGTTAFRLVDTRALSVDFSVAPEDAAGLVSGTPVNLQYADQKLTGRVKDGDRVAGADRLVPISVRLDDPGAAPALPVGASVQVRYRVRLGGGLQVPVSAIQQSGGSNVVFVNRGGVARQVPVGIVAESGDVAVVSGLGAGDPVISPLPPSLADGAAVQVQSGQVQGGGSQ